MKLMKLRSPLGSLLVVALLVSLPCLGSEAQARGGGGGHGGGYSGGSFRGTGGHAEGPRGGEAYRGPGGGTAYKGPGGGEAYRGPGGHEAYKGPGGQTVSHSNTYSGTANITKNVNVSGNNWNAYHGPGWGGVAAGAAAGLAVGTVVGALSASAQPLIVGGQTYYYENNNYYQPCYQGTDVSYCVVPNPNQ